MTTPSRPKLRGPADDDLLIRKLEAVAPLPEAPSDFDPNYPRLAEPNGTKERRH